MYAGLTRLPVAVPLSLQPSFIFGAHKDEASSDTVGGGSGTPEQTSIAIALAFAAAVSAALAFLGIRRVNVRPVCGLRAVCGCVPCVL